MTPTRIGAGQGFALPRARVPWPDGAKPTTPSPHPLDPATSPLSPAQTAWLWPNRSRGERTLRGREKCHGHPRSSHPADHRLLLPRGQWTGPRIPGKGLRERLCPELRKARVTFTQQQSLDVFYDGEKVGRYFADLVVEGRVLVEIKAVQTLEDVHIAQCLNYLRATGVGVCLLVNFGKAKIEVRRLEMNRVKKAGAFELEVEDVP